MKVITMKKITASLRYVTIPLFLLLIYVPLIWSLPGIHKINLRRFVDMEKRSPNTYPGIPTTFKEVADFPKGFENAFNDHFGFRRDLITIYKLAMFLGLNVSTNPNNVVIGKDGYLFLGNDYFSTFDRHTGLRPPTPEEIDALIDAETKKLTWLNRRGIKYLFAIAPNKYSIYPEYLPAYVKQAKYEMLATRFHDQALSNHLPVVDLRPALLEAKREYGDLAYAKTDSHWSNLGAFYGYVAILKQLNRQAGPLKSLELKGFDTSEGKAYNLEGLLGLRKHYKMQDIAISLNLNHSSPNIKAFKFNGQEIPWNDKEEVHYSDRLIIKNSDGLNNISIFMLRDSFTNRLSPLLNQTFTKMAYSHYNHPDTPNDIIKHLMEFKPAILLYEMVEVNLAGVKGVYSPWESPRVCRQEAIKLWPKLKSVSEAEDIPVDGESVTIELPDYTSVSNVILKVDSRTPLHLEYATTGNHFRGVDTLPEGTTYQEIKGTAPIAKIRLTSKRTPGAFTIDSVSIRAMSETALRELYH